MTQKLASKAISLHPFWKRKKLFLNYIPERFFYKQFLANITIYHLTDNLLRSSKYWYNSHLLDFLWALMLQLILIPFLILPMIIIYKNPSKHKIEKEADSHSRLVICSSVVLCIKKNRILPGLSHREGFLKKGIYLLAFV